MKIFDSSPLIAIFNQFQYPQAFDYILQLGHELAITNFVWDELKDDSTRSNVKRLIKEGKLRQYEKNSLKEINKTLDDGLNAEIGEI